LAKVITAGAVAECWLGGRKKVSDSVPIFLLLFFKKVISEMKQTKN